MHGCIAGGVRTIDVRAQLDERPQRVDDEPLLFGRDTRGDGKRFGACDEKSRRSLMNASVPLARL